MSPSWLLVFGPERALLSHHFFLSSSTGAIRNRFRIKRTALTVRAHFLGGVEGPRFPFLESHGFTTMENELGPQGQPKEEGKPMSAAPVGEILADTVVHRIGGRDVVNLRLKQREEALLPPGFSVLLEGTPAEAAEQMRQAFPDPVKFAQLHQLSEVVGSTTAAAIAQAGFALLLAPSARFPNHARVIHPDGVAGFSDANLHRLSQVFHDTPTPRP